MNLENFFKNGEISITMKSELYINEKSFLQEEISNFIELEYLSELTFFVETDNGIVIYVKLTNKGDDMSLILTIDIDGEDLITHEELMDEVDVLEKIEEVFMKYM